ncbi:helix-turn-helix transcriptional regulator [Micromonospora sp. CPCC 206061]|uniref:helix-turn-helix transcriptional regulator n=1 Tax=Micromonospora sp. CPCC 206061 TaxID=3122410 RepID=UPI002FF43C0B
MADVRASRLFTMVLLLQARGAMTAAELAGEVGVSERTVYRDITALAAAGVPVYAEQGRHGGYRLVDGYRTRLTGLSRVEAEALFLLGLYGPARDMGLGDVLATAQLKVSAALPAGLRDAAAQAAQRFYLDVPGWFHDNDPPPALSVLVRAVWQDLTVILRYHRHDEVTRTVQPYGVVLKAGIWYLVARVGADLRVYRVDRVVAVEVTDQRFVREESFDLPTVWAERAAQFVRGMLAEQVTVRLSQAGLRALRFAVEPPAVQAATDAAGEPDAQGWVVTRLPVESAEVAYDQLLRLGPEVEVLAPQPLRERMRVAAQRLARLYQR